MSVTLQLNTFDGNLRLMLNCYPENSIEQTKCSQSPSNKTPQPANTEWSYLKILYISEQLNHRITNIFKKENIPVLIAYKSYTLRWALSHTSTECKYTRDKCPISNTRMCLRRNAVYQLTCNSCDHAAIHWKYDMLHHDHVKEHLNNENSSV